MNNGDIIPGDRKPMGEMKQVVPPDSDELRKITENPNQFLADGPDVEIIQFPGPKPESNEPQESSKE